jgi:hypothetical protein
MSSFEDLDLPLGSSVPQPYSPVTIPACNIGIVGRQSHAKYFFAVLIQMRKNPVVAILS